MLNFPKKLKTKAWRNYKDLMKLDETSQADSQYDM